MTAAEFADERLSYSDVAALLDRPASTLRSWVCLGLHDFPRPVRIGSKPYFLRREIDAWVADRRKPRSKSPAS